MGTREESYPFFLQSPPDSFADFIFAIYLNPLPTPPLLISSGLYGLPQVPQLILQKSYDRDGGRFSPQNSLP